MNRILPAPIYRELTLDTWGADAVRPRDIQNGIEDPEWAYWGGEFVWGLVKLEFGHFRGHTFPAAALNRVIDLWFAIPVRAICLAVVGLLDEAPFVEMVEQVALCAAFAEIADAGPSRAVHSDADAAVVEVAPVLFRCRVAAYSCKDSGSSEEACGWFKHLGLFR